MHPASGGNGPLEDPRTFWERSNARLGVQAGGEDPSGRRKGRGPVEYPCSVCGTIVVLDRWPKHRHEVRCEPCKATVSSLLGDDEDAAPTARSPHERPERPIGNARLDGLPEMTAEDLEALAEIRASRTGDVSVLTRTGGGAARRRRGGKPGGAPGNGSNGAPERRRDGLAGAPDKADGGRRKRRRRRGEGPGTEAAAATTDPAPVGEA